MGESEHKIKSIEKYVEDTIIEYLRSQEEIPEHYQYDFHRINEQEQAAAEQRQKSLFVVEELINDILDDVDRTILFEEDYNKAVKRHHQYALFELADVIPGFALDKTIIRQLCFHEALIVSNVDKQTSSTSNKIIPQAVGGLSLNVELARGLPPIQPLATEEDIDRNISKKIQRIKEELARNNTTENVETEKEPEEVKLKKYEQFLQEQIENAPRKFVIHLSSEFDVEGKNAGSRIVSWVDKDFHTLEEKRTEYIYNEDKSSNQQVLYYAIQENKYYVKHSSTFENLGETKKYYRLSQIKDMIGEGANFILMRYLAIIKFKGTFELSTMYINGDICCNVYECKGPRPGFVNGHPVDLCKIYRSIKEKCGIIHVSVTVLTINGMIVSQEWEGCPYIIHINPLFVTNGKPVPYDMIALKKCWETDMEFMSKYLDSKVEAEFKMKTYLKHHPEIQNMISDYLQSILLLKPEHIMSFTADFFQSFEPYRLPQTPYFNDFQGGNDNETSDMFW